MNRREFLVSGGMVSAGLLERAMPQPAFCRQAQQHQVLNQQI
jgi:hypothetical protein